VTDLAKLVVRLEAQTAQYMQQLDAATKKLDKFTKQTNVSAKNIAAGVAAAAVGAATAFAAMGKAAIDNADKLYKMSQSTGVSVEALSQLEYVADLSGSSADDLSKSLAKLSRNAVEAAKGAAAPAEAFDQLGIAVEGADGKIRNTEDLLLDVADKFSKMEDGAAKSALAMEIFGKSGVQLIPFLNQGRAGIEALKKEADAFGLTIGTDAAQAAEVFNDNLSRVQAAGKGLANQFIQENIPMLTSLSQRLVESAKSGGALHASVMLLSGVFKTLVSAGAIVGAVFQNLGRVIYGVGAAIVRVAQGEFKLAMGELKDAFGDVGNNVEETASFIADVWAENVQTVSTAAKAVDQDLKETIFFNDKKAEDAAKKAAEAASRSLTDMIADLTQQIETFGMAEGAIIRYRLAHGDLAEAVRLSGEAGAYYAQNIIALTDATVRQTEAEEANKKAQEDINALMSEGASLTESLRTPTEEYADTIQRLNELLDAGAISADTYYRAQGEAKEAFDDASKVHNKFLEEANKNAVSILGDGLYTAVNDGMKRGVKGAAQAFADMLTRLAAEAAAASLMKKLFGSEGIGSGGGLLGAGIDFVGGLFRDTGGRGQKGRPYMIGTGAQPEMFVPDTAGEFYPADQWMGMGGRALTQNIYVPERLSSRSARQLALDSSRGQRIAARLGG